MRLLLRQGVAAVQPGAISATSRDEGSTDTRAPGDFRIAQGKQSSSSLEPTRLDVVRSGRLAQGRSRSCLAEIVSVTARMERGATSRGLER